MRVLSIGSERNLFVKNSDAQKRIQEYGMLFNELHIIVFANKNLGYKNINVSNNIFLYPTNHKYKISYLWHIYKIANLLIASHKFLVITVQDPFESGLAGWFLKLKYKLPLQIQIHTDLLSPYFWQESWKNKGQVLLAKFLLPRADGIRVVSERIKDSLNSRFLISDSKITVLPVFVDVKKIQSAKIKINLHEKYPDQFIILMASRLTKEKNIGMAIEAMRDIIKKYPNALLLIVGDGPEENKLKAQSLGLEANIIFEPWTSDLVSYYKTADLFLATSNYEGYGRTVIESMAAGLPAVMTDVGLAGEILVDDLDGLVIPVQDIKALIGAILSLMENRGKRENLVVESRKVAESLISKEDYLQLYKKTLEKISKNA